MKPSETRTLLFASIGGALEFYDFGIFVFFTSVIAKIDRSRDRPAEEHVGGGRRKSLRTLRVQLRGPVGDGQREEGGVRAVEGAGGRRLRLPGDDKRVTV